MTEFNIWEHGKQYKGGKVAILGNGPSVMQKEESTEGVAVHIMDMTKIDCPIWTVNGGWDRAKEQCTLGFIMDDWDWYLTPAFKHRDKEWFLSLTRDSDIPIIVSHKNPDIPNANEYPLEEVTRRTGTCFTGESVQQMIALAICFGVKEIELYGCDYSNQERRPYERCGTEGWLMYAKARGIKVSITEFSNLFYYPAINDHFQSGVYGYSVEKIAPTIPKLIQLMDDYYGNYKEIIAER